MMPKQHPTERVNAWTVSLLAAVLLATGCARADRPSANPCLLLDLYNGETTREEIFLHFGPPSRTMENERVLFYRLGQNREGDFVREVEDKGWANIRFSLVLVLNEHGVLQEHSLVRVR